MSRRPVALLALLPLALGAVAAVQPPPASAPMRYRIETAVSSVADLSGFGMGEQKNEFAVTALVTITLTDSAGGKVIHAVLDSSGLGSAPPPGVPAGMIEGEAGATYHGWINPQGRTEHFKAMGDSTAPKGGAIVTQVLKDFFPNVKPGIKAGDTWRDSSETTETEGANTSTTTRITEYRVGEEAPWAGATGYKVEASSTFTYTGASETPAGPQNIEGSGSGTATWYVTAAGEFLGGTSTSSSDLLAMTSFGDVPVKQGTTTTITALR